VFTATDEQSALRTIAEEKPQIVLLDIIMPGINGINTLTAIIRIDPEIKVIMISALNNRDFTKKAIAVGSRRLYQ